MSYRSLEVYDSLFVSERIQVFTLLLAEDYVWIWQRLLSMSDSFQNNKSSNPVKGVMKMHIKIYKDGFFKC